MKFCISILVLIIAGVNSISSTAGFLGGVNFSQKRSIMTLLTQVESKLKAGGPLNAITDMLKEFVDTVTEEQVAHDKLYQDQKVECDEEFEFREQEITNAAAALAESQETLDGCTQQKSRAEKDLSVTKQQLIDTRSHLATVEDTRRREAYDYETKSTAFELATNAVDEALVILDEIWSGEASFLQLSKHVNTLLKHTVKVRKAHLMNGVMAAMVQLANKDVQADDELLKRVKSLLENFKEKVQNALQQAVALEQAAIEAYTEEKTRLTNSIESLTSQQAGLESEINELNKCIVVQSGIVTAASIKKQRNERLLADATALCESVEVEYKVASDARKEELELLELIRQRVETRFAEMSEGVRERGKQDEFTYDAQNDYVHEEFKK